MANTDKNLVITPNIGSSTGDPTINFSGADASSGAQSLQARIYPTSNGTLAFEGSAGQLFSITNSLTGTLFSVNDVSGIPSIEVLDNGSVRLARYNGNVLIGNVVDNGVDKLQFGVGSSVSFNNVTGNTMTSLSGFAGNGSLLTNLNGSNVATGTIANARTTASSANGANLIVTRGAAGEFSAGAITATTFTGSGSGLTSIPNSATTASSANGANLIVARDASGNFVANRIDANISKANPQVFSTDGEFSVVQNVSSWTLSTSHPIIRWSFNTPYDDNTMISSGGNAAPTTQTSLVVSEVGGIIFGKSNTTPSTNSVLSTEWGRANSAGIFLTSGIVTSAGLNSLTGGVANNPGVWSTSSFDGTSTPFASISGGTGERAPAVSLTLWNTTASAKPTFSLSRSKSGTVGTFSKVSSGDVLGSVDFQGDDGTKFDASASLMTIVDGETANNIIPSAFTIRTVRPTGGIPVAGLHVSPYQSVSVGSTVIGSQVAGATATSSTVFTVAGNIRTNNASGTGQAVGMRVRSIVSPDVTVSGAHYETWFYSDDVVFTTTNFQHYNTAMVGKADRHTVTNLAGYNIGSGFHGGTNNYGFQSSLNAPPAGTTAASAISSLSVTSNVVTVTTSTNHGLTTGQIVTIATNTIAATSTVAGVEYTIVSVGDTNFTSIGAANTSSFVGNISGTTLTVTGVNSGYIRVGTTIFGSGITAGTQITAAGTGTGGPGTYTVNNSHTVSGVTFTGLTPGITFTATGAGTGTGTVRLQTDGSGITIANTGVATFTYSRTTANVSSVAVGGTVTPNRRYSLYFPGSADSYMAGRLGIGTETPAFPLDVTGTVRATTFSGAIVGDGSGLSNLNAANVATGTLSNARTTATSANTASAIVARGTAGEFSAGNITVKNIDSDVTIGANSSTSLLDVTYTIDNTESISALRSKFGIRSTIEASDKTAEAFDLDLYGVQGLINSNYQYSITGYGNLYGTQGRVNVYDNDGANNKIDSVHGTYGTVVVYGANSVINNVRGTTGAASINGAVANANIQNMAAAYLDLRPLGASTSNVTSTYFVYGVYGGGAATANVGNAYGIHIGSDINNYLGGSLKIGSAGGAPTGNTGSTIGLEVSEVDGATIRLTSTDTTGALDQMIGQIQFYGSDSDAPGAGVKAKIATYMTPAAGDGSYLTFSTSDGTTNDIERVRILSSGNVGIGTIGPTERLEVNGTVKATLFSGSGASLTSVPAGQLSGTIPSAVLGNSSLFIGTTSVALNRASADLAIAGITSITGRTGGSLTIESPAAATGSSQSITITTGNATQAAAVNSGGLNIYTGNVTDAAGTGAGFINIKPGTSGGGISFGSALNLSAGDVFTTGSSGGTATLAGGKNTVTSGTAIGGAVYVTGGAVSTVNAITKNTGSVYIDGGGSGASGAITYGSVFIGNQSNGVTYGTTHVTIGKSGTEVRLPGVGTSGFVKLSTNGALIQDTSTYAATNQTMFIGTTSVAINRASASLALTGITSIDGSAATFTSTTQNSQFNSIGVGTAGSGTAGEIRATNNITAYYSDERLKTNLGNIDNALDKVSQLNGFYHEANELAQSLGYEKIREVGVSAQEVQRVLPEVVAAAPISDEYLTVRYERIVPLLIEAIKELKAELDAIKREMK